MRKEAQTDSTSTGFWVPTLDLKYLSFISEGSLPLLTSGHQLI